MWQIKRSFDIIQKEGFSSWLSSTSQYFKDKRKPIQLIQSGIISAGNWEYITNFKKYEKKPYLPKPQKNASYTINWIIPPFGKGSGGHLNIFRYIKLLENLGHFNRIYILGHTKFSSDEAKRAICRDFFNLDAEVYVSIDDVKDSDALVATSWETTYFVNKIGNTYKKFYFIQDFEPYFFPIGSNYYLAEQTYFFDFKRITMGPWVSQHILQNFGLKSDYINFGYDPSIYGTTSPDYERQSNHHIFFYSRPATARRCFELGLEAFKELDRRGIKFELYTIGEKLEQYDIPFRYNGLGILDAYELAKLYSNTDLGVVFSSTNTSLLPYEMMACGCPVVELDSPSNRATFPNSEIIKLAHPNPLHIADAIEEILTDQKKRRSQAQKAYEYVKTFTWEKSVKELENIFRKELSS